MSAPVAVKQFPLEQEYAKKTGISPEDVAKLRAWLATQPHLPGDLVTDVDRRAGDFLAQRISIAIQRGNVASILGTMPQGPLLDIDLDLVLVYHCCGRSAEVSKQVLDLNLTLKTLFENLFKDRLVTQKTIDTLSMCITLPLKARAHDGSALFYCVLIDPDSKKFVFHECIRVALMVLELWQEEEGTWPGLQIIFDMNLFSLQHLAKLDLQTIQQFLYYLQEAMLVKVTALHFMNAPSFIDKVMMLIKPFMKKALIDCLFIHQVGSTGLEKHMPMEGLPEEAGGKYTGVTKASADLRERMLLNKDYFEQETRRRVVEANRPGRPKTISDIFGGVEGSFKKLDID